MQWTASPLLFLRTVGTLIQSAAVSQSSSPLGPIQHRPSLRTLLAPVPMPVRGGGRQHSSTCPGSCWELHLLPRWEALARAVSLYCLLKWRFRCFPGRKNLSLKDTSQIWDTAIWGHPQAEGNRGQKRLWEPDKACEEERQQQGQHSAGQELKQWEQTRE